MDNQRDIISVEEKKQDGLKKLAQSTGDNETSKEVQQQLIESSMAIKHASRNLQKLKVD